MRKKNQKRKTYREQTLAIELCHRKRKIVLDNILLKRFTNTVNRYNNKCKNRNTHCIVTASIIQMS